MGLQIMIGQVVLLTGGALQGVASVRVHVWFPGLAGSRLQLHLAQQRQSTWQPALLVYKPDGFTSY